MLETLHTPDAPTPESVARAVEAEIAAVMRMRGLDPTALAPSARLSETLGLKSMDLAQVVVTLEDRFGCDPFATRPITSIRTVGDLTGAWLAALGLAEAPVADLTAELAAAEARAARRRR